MIRLLKLPSLILIGFLLTFLLTWPLVLKINTFYGEASDYSLVGWILWYNQESIVTGRILDQQSYFNANQFFPFPFSLAYSEHLFVPSLIFAPIYWLSRNLVFSVNFFAILTFVLTFVSSFYCLYFFVRKKSASLVGAFIFTFNPLTFAHFFGHHLQLVNKFFLPPLFLFAYLYIKKPTWRNSFFFFLFFTLNALSGIYLQIFSLIFIPLFWLPFLFSYLMKKNIKFFFNFLRTALIFLIFLPILLYFNLPYLKFANLEGVYRTLEENSNFSARGIDWTSSLRTNLLYGRLVQSLDPFREPKDLQGSFNYTEHVLFPNIVPILLFLVGLFSMRRGIAFVAFSLVLFFSAVFTFGPYFHGWNNKIDTSTTFYYNLYQSSQIFGGIRVLTRFQIIFYLPFVLFIAFGVDRISKLNKKTAVLILGFIYLFLLLENINKANFDSTSPTLDYIDSKKEEKNSLISLLTRKNTIHFPLFTAGVFRNVRYLNWSTQTGERIFNGYSGYAPGDWIKNAEEIKRLDKQALEKMYVLGINYLIIHKDLISEEGVQAYTDNIILLSQGITYADEKIEVIDLEKFKTSTCTARDLKFEVRTVSYPVAQNIGTIFQLFPKIALVNPKNCYIVSKFQDRYSKVDLLIKGKKQSLQIKLPILIEPFEKIEFN